MTFETTWGGLALFLACAALGTAQAHAQDADAGVPPSAPPAVAPADPATPTDPAATPPPPATAPQAAPASAPTADAPPADTTQATPPADGNAAGLGQAAAPATEQTATPGSVGGQSEESLEDPGDVPFHGHSPFFWRNSIFTFDNALNLYAYSPAAQLTYNPTYIQTYSFLPRFYPVEGENYFIRLNQTMQIELTDADGETGASLPTTLNRYPYVYDMTVDFIKPALLNLEGVIVTAGIRTAVPWSILSIRNQLILPLGVTSNISYAFGDSGVTLIVIGNYVHNFNAGSQTTTTTPYQGLCSTPSPQQIANGGTADSSCGYLGGPTTVSDSFTYGPTLNFAPIPELTLTLSYIFISRLGRPLGPAYVGAETQTGGVFTPPEQSPTHWRNLFSFSASVAYDLAKWLNLSANWSTFSGLYDPSGNVYNPFVTPNTQLTITATITLDQLYDVITGEGVQLTEEQLRRIRQGQAQAPQQQRGM